LILMDYPNRRRLKIWGRARAVEGAEAADILAALHNPGDPGRPERAIVITVEAIDWNCPAHIPQRLTLSELEPHLAQLRARIDALTTENAALTELVRGATISPTPLDGV
jgi:predicted pyridoxine 5'-phosphate oxidase superfamily flavin-nucleotide-binding protein